METSRPLSSIEALPEDVLFVVLDNLDLKSRFRLGACASRILGSVVAHKNERVGWSYYPFSLMSDDTWRRFYLEVWRRAPVTRALRKGMAERRRADGIQHVHDMRLVDEPWTPGEDLWRFSDAPNIWYDRILQSVEEYVQAEGVYSDWRHEFARDLWEDVRWQGMTRGEFAAYVHQEFLESDTYADIWHEHEPVRGGLQPTDPCLADASPLAVHLSGGGVSRCASDVRRRQPAEPGYAGCRWARLWCRQGAQDKAGRTQRGGCSKVQVDIRLGP
jgi:hypothetical protein